MKELNTVETPIGDRLLHFALIVSPTLFQFESKCGISHGLINGSKKCELNCKTLVKVLNAYPDLSAEWVLRGEGEMLKSSTALAPGSDIMILTLEKILLDVLTEIKNNSLLNSKQV